MSDWRERWKCETPAWCREVDLYATLGVEIHANFARVRRQYHVLSTKLYSKFGDDVSKNEQFRCIGLAYRILGDEELKRIYETHGIEGVHKAEQYAENSVFDLDFYHEFHEFYAGKDPEVREYLLLCAGDDNDDDVDVLDEGEPALEQKQQQQQEEDEESARKRRKILSKSVPMMPSDLLSRPKFNAESGILR